MVPPDPVTTPVDDVSEDTTPQEATSRSAADGSVTDPVEGADPAEGADRSDAPTTDRSDAPTTDRSDAPTTDCSDAPTTDGSDAPTTDRDDSVDPGATDPGNAKVASGVARTMPTALADRLDQKERSVTATAATTDTTETAAPVTPHGAPPPSQILPGETGDEIFNRLILPEMEIMWRVALSLTRNRADAEDVVQEALLRAYRAIHTFDGRYPRAWVLTILRNTEHNRHRRKRPQLLNDPDSVEERGPATEPDLVERYAEDREFDEAVTNALAKLPDNFRQVIELIDIDGLAYQEAADVLDIPLGTVMSRLHRARRRIRDLLIPLGYGPHTHTHTHASHDDSHDGSADTKPTTRLEERS